MMCFYRKIMWNMHPSAWEDDQAWIFSEFQVEFWEWWESPHVSLILSKHLYTVTDYILIWYLVVMIKNWIKMNHAFVSSNCTEMWFDLMGGQTGSAWTHAIIGCLWLMSVYVCLSWCVSSVWLKGVFPFLPIWCSQFDFWMHKTASLRNTEPINDLWQINNPTSE